MLLTARKAADKTPLFNFEAVYMKYKQFKTAQSGGAQAMLVEISKQTFLKIFLDLVNLGFLRSESETDILSVNNKVALGFRARDLDLMIEKHRNEMDIPQDLLTWLTVTT